MPNKNQICSNISQTRKIGFIQIKAGYAIFFLVQTIMEFNNSLMKQKKRGKKKLEQSQNLIVNMRPEFVEALHHSQQFSNSRGRSVFLLKETSKQKRKRNEIEEVKTEEESFKKDRQQFLKDYKKLKRDNQELENEILQMARTKQVIQNLVQNGIIDQNGQPLYEEYQENSQNQVFQI